MKAIAVTPGQPDSVHLRDDVPKPSVDSVPDGKGVLVKLLSVGVDATDREINDALYGNSPPGDDYLILGHESFGIVEAVGSAVKSVKPGDYVTATVRRPGNSIFDYIGTSDMTAEETYYERGINLLHGYLTEYFVDEEEFIVKVPEGLKHLHVLMEPMSCAAKAVEQIYEIQRRLKVWKPQRAFVMGAGQIGLLATLCLKLRGLEVFTIARSEPPTLNAEIVEGYEANYISSRQESVGELVKRVGKPDIIIDATGSSFVSFDSMNHLAINGVLCWTSITGGENETNIPADSINLNWVLGNKCLFGSVNANRTHFEKGIIDLAMGELHYPGVTEKILTNPVEGFEGYKELIRLLVEEKDALKVYMNIASE